MKAAVFEGKGKLMVNDVPEPQLETRHFPKKYKKGEFIVSRKEDQVKLKVLVASICGTDLYILDVPPRHDAIPGVVLGHEYIGEVVEVGENVRNLEKGDRVVVDPNIKCGSCWLCRNNLASLCQDMTTLGIFCDGGFAQYNVAPAKQVFKIPKDLEPKKAIFFEPLTCATHCWGKLSPQIGESILILGAGPMGCYFIELARISGASQIIVSEPSAFRRDFARKMGASLVIDPIKEDLGKQVLEATNDRGADIAIDVCGVPEVIKQAVELTRSGGKIALFGQQNSDAFADRVSFTRINQKELKIFGSFATTRSFDQTIDVLKKEDLRIKELITHQIPLDEIHQGIDLMRKREAIEIVIYPNK